MWPLHHEDTRGLHASQNACLNDAQKNSHGGGGSVPVDFSACLHVCPLGGTLKQLGLEHPASKCWYTIAHRVTRIFAPTHHLPTCQSHLLVLLRPLSGYNGHSTPSSPAREHHSKYPAMQRDKDTDVTLIDGLPQLAHFAQNTNGHEVWDNAIVQNLSGPQACFHCDHNLWEL